MLRATEGSTAHSPSVFGVETALWSTAAKTVGEWYRGILEAAERFTVTWNEDEAEKKQAAPCIRHGWRPREWGGGGQQ